MTPSQNFSLLWAKIQGYPSTLTLLAKPKLCHPLFSSPMHSHLTNTSIFLSPTVNTSIYLHPELYTFRRTGTRSATLYYLLWYLSTMFNWQQAANEKDSIKTQAADSIIWSMFCSKSNEPVPISTMRPITIRADGDSRWSVCFCTVASIRNVVAVSKLIFRNGDGLELMPIRLHGR